MTLRVKVTPRAPRTEVAGRMADGTLKVKIAAPPEQGKANAELCRLLASHYRVDVKAVRVISGHGASLKLVRIDLPQS